MSEREQFEAWFRNRYQMPDYVELRVENTPTEDMWHAWQDRARIASPADELRRAVRAITQMLSDREWAEHVSRDLDASALESAVTDLHNDLHEANERIDELEAQLAAAPATPATQPAQEPAGTLHDDGYFTWKGASPYEANFAGWRRDFYLSPVAAQTAPVAAPAQPETWKVLPSPTQPAISVVELAAFHRFCDCCEDFDSGGYDVAKDMMSRLARIGLVRSCGFGRYESTEFGDVVRESTTPTGEPLQEAKE